MVPVIVNYYILVTSYSQTLLQVYYWYSKMVLKGLSAVVLTTSGSTWKNPGLLVYLYTSLTEKKTPFS